jgi:ABC-type transport system substrate-binding protein
MAGLKLSFLGPPHIELAGKSLDLDARKNVALLAYLSVTAESHTRETVITLLWPELSPSRARAVLRRNLSMLKKALGGEWLHVDREIVGLEQHESLWVDTTQFQQYADSWQRHRHPETQICQDCLDELTKATSLYRGDFLTGFSLRDSASFDDWQFYQTEALRQQFATILEKLVQGHFAISQFKAALPFAQRWLSLDPLHEPAQRALMQLYARSGQRSAALKQYHECERLLATELGVKPEQETSQLFQRIKAQRKLPQSEDLLDAGIPGQEPILVTTPKIAIGPQHPRRSEQVRMVGRQQELEAARDLWNHTLAASGQTLLISGEAGIGKTRLVRELTKEIETTGGTAITGGCFMEGGTPYAPFRQIIRAVAHHINFTDLQTGVSLPDFVIPDLLTLVPDLRPNFMEFAATVHPEPNQAITPQSVSIDPPAEQQRLFENLGIFFRSFSDRTPLLLVLEDVQWADSGTLRLAQYLVRHTRQARIMIVITFRNVPPDEAPLLHEIVLDLNREQIVTNLYLPPLRHKETGELLFAIFSEEITPEFLDSIYSETEGNPFFIEEVCKALIESGKVFYKDGSWHGPSVAELGIPQNVRVAIQQRVGSLPAETQEILNMAAILGRKFDFDTLVNSASRSSAIAKADYEDIVIESLENAERAQLIDQVSGDYGGTYSFVHSLIASTLVESLKALTRRRLHRYAVSAIEKRHPDDYEALVYHYVQADQEDRAVKYLLLAGDRARVLHAHQEAIDSYQLALEFLKAAGDLELAARTSMKLGLTYNNAFNFKAARQAYEDGFKLWQQIITLKPLTPPPPAPHPLKVAAFKPETLDFRIVIDTPSVSLLYQLFSGLIEVGPEMDIVPNLAQSWEVLDNGTKYIFHLRDDVYWSDGVQVTAHDFVVSWQWVLDPNRGWSAAEYLLDVKNAQAFATAQISDPNLVGVYAQDNKTLVVDLESPTSYFLYSLSVIDTYPFPTHIVEAYGDSWIDLENIVTNGPFKLVSWEPDEFIILERNPKYHGRFPGNVQRVEYSFHSGDLSQHLQKYEENDLDMCCDLSPDEMIHARQKFAGEYATAPWLSLDFIGFDVKSPPFNDVRVRRAFALAIDKGGLADFALRGFAFPATGGVVPPGMSGHSDDISLPYDPERARNLLNEAGYPTGAGFPEIVCLARDDPGHDLMANYLHTQWREILGVDINWQMTEWGRFSDKNILDGVHMWLVAWAGDYPDPDNFLRVLWWKDPAWQHNEYRRLLESARQVTDQEERMRLYQQADRILSEEVPILPLSYGRLHMLVKPWIKRLPTSPLRNWFWKDIILENHD